MVASRRCTIMANPPHDEAMFHSCADVITRTFRDIASSALFVLLLIPSAPPDAVGTALARLSALPFVVLDEVVPRCGDMQTRVA